MGLGGGSRNRVVAGGVGKGEVSGEAGVTRKSMRAGTNQTEGMLQGLMTLSTVANGQNGSWATGRQCSETYDGRVYVNGGIDSKLCGTSANVRQIAKMMVREKCPAGNRGTEDDERTRKTLPARQSVGGLMRSFALLSNAL